ncbi:hypothetical protein CALVIDRAFT_530905 [Calocera viscosa TUFC12733]|uniref:Uncharacterized protein n=1 Tax=Calocera viscosa (strain TUFC12733) TaxID=1330018 RepID=A0A167H6R7_CALVF|nr:hypothetical protein CALVIDRAFT_530905 [Calocera viscosa TUFC12733]
MALAKGRRASRPMNRNTPQKTLGTALRARPSSSRPLSTTSSLYAATAAKQVTRTKKTPFVRIEGPSKAFKPITLGLRYLLPLTVVKRKTGGRNKAGRITASATVIRVEFDPRRSAHVALIRQLNPKTKQIFSYAVTPDGIHAGDVVESYRDGIPDGLVEGFVDLHRRGQTATTEVTEPLPVKGARVPPAEPEEGSVARLEAELAALEAVAEQAALEAAALHVAEEVEDGRMSTRQAGSALDVVAARSRYPTHNEHQAGNVLPLQLLRTGVHVHNISLHSYGPGKLAEVVLHEEDGKYSHVKLQSGDVRKIGQEGCATIERVSSEHWKGRQLGKAGRSRNLGIRSHVRGVAMNAVDHLHRGGRGKSKGNKHPRSIYSWLAKHQRTRKPGPRGNKSANRMAEHERPTGFEKPGGAKRKLFWIQTQFAWYTTFVPAIVTHHLVAASGVPAHRGADSGLILAELRASARQQPSEETQTSLQTCFPGCLLAVSINLLKHLGSLPLLYWGSAADYSFRLSP